MEVSVVICHWAKKIGKLAAPARFLSVVCRFMHKVLASYTP